MMPTIKKKNRGFTFLEILITVLLIGMVVAWIIPNFWSQIVHPTSGILPSLLPAENLRAAAELQAVMENMNGRYLAISPKTPTVLETFQGDINSNTYNFGTYTVLENAFIRFISGTEAADTAGAHTILKVTITNSNGGTLTQLFTDQD
jgi:prepilin-type N-terminal cleavage/methylation domain-containing protein